MGYFLDYELFTPCWFCGRTDCNGDHRGPQAEAVRRWLESLQKPERVDNRCKEIQEETPPLPGGDGGA